MCRALEFVFFSDKDRCVVPFREVPDQTFGLASLPVDAEVNGQVDSQNICPDLSRDSYVTWTRDFDSCSADLTAVRIPKPLTPPQGWLDGNIMLVSASAVIRKCSCTTCAGSLSRKPRFGVVNRE